MSDPLCVSTPKSNKLQRLGKSEIELTSDSEAAFRGQASKRGTLTSLSSSSSATPPSTSTEERGVRRNGAICNYSSDSLPSLVVARRGATSKSMNR